MTDDPYNGKRNGFPRPLDIVSAADYGTIAARLVEELPARLASAQAGRQRAVTNLERVRRRLAELRARRLAGA